MKISENVPISELTTMRLGGSARFVLDIESVDEVRGAYTFAKEQNLPVFILGSGANTIGHDSGFPGVILRNHILGIDIVAQNQNGDIALNEDLISDDSIIDECLKLGDGAVVWRAAGGEVWNDFVLRVTADGYTGVETLAAIPGTVGAAPVQNIGAYGSEVANTIFAVEVFDTLDSEYKTLFPDELDFSYRHSIFNSTAAGRYFIIAVLFRLHQGSLSDPLPDGSTRPLYASLQTYLDEHHITDFSPASIAAAVTAIREAKLPDPAKVASAGSFFKNVYLTDAAADAAEQKGVPVRRSHGENKVNTGWLVENCGLLGKDLHGFKINEKAALVLVNDHATSYADLAAARADIVKAVKTQFGIDIEQEPVEIPKSSAEFSHD